MSEEIEKEYRDVLESLNEFIEYCPTNKFGEIRRQEYIKWSLLLKDLFIDWQKRGELIKDQIEIIKNRNSSIKHLQTRIKELEGEVELLHNTKVAYNHPKAFKEDT